MLKTNKKNKDTNNIVEKNVNEVKIKQNIENNVNEVKIEENIEKNVEQNIEQPVIRKKGRPRKNVTEVPVVQKVEEKKKRGRKKKECVEEVKKKKKRGRKAAVKFFSSSIRKKIPLTTVMKDNNGYILHLDVKEENEANFENNIKSKTEYDLEDDNNIIQDDKNKLLNMILYKLKEDNKEFAEELEKEYDDLLENDNSILTDFLENKESGSSLRDLYEKRIENREKQDTILIDKLENLHKEKEIFDKITFTEDINEDESLYKKNCKNTENENIKNDNRKKGFFEVLSNFIENKKWLEKTDVCCWWCCHKFDTVPLGLPIYYNNVTNKFQVKGIFCSFACIVAYKNTIKYKIKNIEYLIKYLYTKLTGAKLSDTIKVAPPRCSLNMFGGELTIEEFRNSFNENKIYKLVEYPMFVSKDYIEEIDIKNVKKVNQSVFKENTTKLHNLDEQRITDAKTRLSKIEKTIVTVGNTIDKFIM